MLRGILVVTLILTGVGCRSSGDPLLAGGVGPAEKAPAAVDVMRSNRELVVGGVAYRYEVLTPIQCKGQPSPLVVALHGRGGDGPSAVDYFGLESLAAKHGFIVVAPSGQNRQWKDLNNDPGQDRDIEFFRQLLDAVPTLGGDPKRIYVTGFSNGGSMTHFLGAAFSDRIAAIAPGGASIGALDDQLEYHTIPDPKRPIPVLMFHGIQDMSCGYDMKTFTVAVPDAAHWWAVKDGLDPQPRHEQTSNGKLLIDRYGKRDGVEVVLMSYVDMGHAWPTTQNANTGIDFNETLWEFFNRHKLP